MDMPPIVTRMGDLSERFDSRMNKTGLAQAMNPGLSSVLLEHSAKEDVWVRTNVLQIPTSKDFSATYGVNYVFDCCPLKGWTTVLKPEKDCLIPRCRKCHAFPDAESAITTDSWRCGICHQVNSVQKRLLCPKSQAYDVCLSRASRPLFLFVFQSDAFFAQDLVRKSVGEVLDKWGSSFDTDVAMVGVGSNTVCVRLDVPRAYVYLDAEDIIVPVCSSQKAKMARGLAVLKPSLEEGDGNFLNCVLACLKSLNRKNICLCVFASTFSCDKPLFKDVKKAFAEYNVSGQLFTRGHLRCGKVARCFDRIRVIGEDSPHLIAPQLHRFLESIILFEPRIVIYYNSSLFEIESAYTSRRMTTGALVDMPMIDGQSSVTYELRPIRVITSSSVNFQISLEAVRIDGMKVLRVISHKMKTTGSVSQFDGVVFGCFLARKRAYQSLTESDLDSYRTHREESIELVSKWSAKGQYRRTIPDMFRDVPVLMFALEVSDLYRKEATEIEQMAAKINMTGLSLELLRRAIYPVFIVPPLSFPQRLERLSTGNFKLFIFIRAFDGIAVNLENSATDEEIEKVVSPFKVPVTVYTSPEVAVRQLVEERGCSFALYTEKIEVEVNGRRF